MRTYVSQTSHSCHPTSTQSQAGQSANWLTVQGPRIRLRVEQVQLDRVPPSFEPGRSEAGLGSW
jgi:hypothetical protein